MNAFLHVVSLLREKTCMLHTALFFFICNVTGKDCPEK